MNMKATIVVQDEVNCTVKGVELDIRKKLVNMFKYDIPSARYMPAYRLGRWDGTVSFFNLGGSTFVNFLPEIIPVLIDNNYEIELDDKREQCTPIDILPIDKSTFSHIKWPEKHDVAGEPIELRDYQVEIVNNFLENPQCLQEIATGAGKTLVTAALSQRTEQYGRSIVIVPNKSLVVQTEADYINMQLDVGVYFGDRKDIGKTHTICTWQSLNTLMKNTKKGVAEITIHDFLEDVVCVIVDEVHSAKADALKTLLTGPLRNVPLRWGLTGTVPKEDYEFASLRVSIGEVINRVSASELQDKGVLANCHVNIVQLIDHAEHSNYQSELKYLLSDSDRLDMIGSLVRKANETGNTLVLVDRVQAGKDIVSRLGENAVFVSGATKGKDRQAQYDEVADSDNKIIVATYGVASVGINIPRIFNLILIEPGKSFVRVIQSIGRGIRRAKDKDEVQIWDITSTCKFAKRHLTKRKKFYREAEYPFSLEKLEWK
jgi:superfamily II DNA or RNA helicase